METIFLRNLCDNLFSSLSIALSLTDDNKIQWNYIWALKCTSAYRFLMTWVFILPTWLIHSQYYSQAFKVYVWAMCHAYIKVRNTEVIIYVYICIYAHIQCTMVLGLWDLHQQPLGSQDFGLGLNYITSVPGFPACRRQLHNTISLINPSSSLWELDIHYWFCFSEEPWLIYKAHSAFSNEFVEQLWVQYFSINPLDYICQF